MKKCKNCAAPLEGILYKTIGKLMGVKPSESDPDTCNKCAEDKSSEAPAEEEKTEAAPAAESAVEESKAEEAPAAKSEEEKKEESNV